MANRYYAGPRSDHFDGKRFFHPGQPSSDKTFPDLLKLIFARKKTAWPKTIPARSGLRPSPHVDGLQIVAIGHASLLIQIAGSNILLDPVWAERVGPFGRIGPRRLNPPAIALEDLPPIDSVLLTHNHYDHLDLRTIDQLWKVHRPFILSPLGNDAVIHKTLPHIPVETGDWWDSFSLPQGIRTTIVPAYHWSSRGIGDRRMALWGGFVLETPAGVIYCSGDTAYRDGKLFPEIRQRFGPPQIAILPIGAYAPRWFMQSMHVNPEEALQIALDCGAPQMLGIHSGTFHLSDEPFDEPQERLRAAAQSTSLNPANIVALHPGDLWQSTVSLSPAP